MRQGLQPALVLAALFTALLLPSCKQSDGSPVTPASTVTQLNANATLAPVSRTQAQGTVVVTDQSGAPVTGLNSSNFSAKLYYGPGIPKTYADSLDGTIAVQTVSQTGKKIAVSLTMDYSVSMFKGSFDTIAQQYNRVLAMERGVKTFVNEMAAGDIAEVIKYGSSVDFVVPFSGAKDILLAAVDSSSYNRGSAALYGSIFKGLYDVGGQSSVTYARAVIAFTTGAENNSTETEADVFALSRSQQIPVYTIGLLDTLGHSDPPGLNSENERRLVRIADTTGGLYYYAPRTDDLDQVYLEIRGALSNSHQMTITWPTTGLPASGTTVQVVITITYGGATTQIVKSLTML